MKQSSDRKDPLFVVNFSCDVLTGVKYETRRHDLATCIIRAKTQKHAEEWGAAHRFKFVNDASETGPSITEEDMVCVEVEPFLIFVENLCINGVTLEQD